LLVGEKPVIDLSPFDHFNSKINEVVNSSRGARSKYFNSWIALNKFDT